MPPPVLTELVVVVVVVVVVFVVFVVVPVNLPARVLTTSLLALVKVVMLVIA